MIPSSTAWLNSQRKKSSEFLTVLGDNGTLPLLGRRLSRHMVIWLLRISSSIMPASGEGIEVAIYDGYISTPGSIRQGRTVHTHASFAPVAQACAGNWHIVSGSAGYLEIITIAPRFVAGGKVCAYAIRGSVGFLPMVMRTS